MLLYIKNLNLYAFNVNYFLYVYVCIFVLVYAHMFGELLEARRGPLELELEGIVSH